MQQHFGLSFSNEIFSWLSSTLWFTGVVDENKHVKENNAQAANLFF